MSVFANLSQTQWTTLPHIFRSRDQEEKHQKECHHEGQAGEDDKDPCNGKDHDRCTNCKLLVEDCKGEKAANFGDGPTITQSEALLEHKTQVIELCDNYEYFSDGAS